MPCRCDYDEYVPKPPKTVKAKNTSENKIIENLRNQLATLGKTYNDLKQECDSVTQLLCYMCGSHIYNHGGLFEFDDRLVKWWKEHDIYDRFRTLENFKTHFMSNPDQCPTRDDVYKWFVKQAEDVHPLSEYHKHEFFNELWDEFTAWVDSRKSRKERIAALKAELAKLESEV